MFVTEDVRRSMTRRGFLWRSREDTRFARRALREMDGLKGCLTLGSPPGVGQPRVGCFDTVGVVGWVRSSGGDGVWCGQFFFVSFCAKGDGSEMDYLIGEGNLRRRF